MKLHCFVCVCCLLPLFCNKAMWFSGLHLVVVFLLLFCVQYYFCFHSFQKRSKKRTRQKTKIKMLKKGQKSNSTVVFTNSLPNVWGVGYKIASLLKSI